MKQKGALNLKRKRPNHPGNGAAEAEEWLRSVSTESGRIGKLSWNGLKTTVGSRQGFAQDINRSLAR